MTPAVNTLSLWTDEDLRDVLNDPRAGPEVRAAAAREIEHRARADQQVT